MKYLRVLVSSLLFLLCACRETIVHDLSETDANKMLTGLLQNQMDVRKDKQADGKWSLSLPTEQSTQAILFLQEHRMLKDTVGLPLKKSGILVSREEQRFQYERALSGEIESTLSGIRGVLQARVHLNLPVMDPVFGQSLDNSKSSASVLLISDNQIIDKAEISALVAGASGIPSSAISVLITLGSRAESIAQKNSSPLLEIARSLVKSESKDSKLLEQTKPVSSQGVAVFSRFNQFFESLPWNWIVFFLALALTSTCVVKYINKRQKVNM